MSLIGVLILFIIFLIVVVELEILSVPQVIVAILMNIIMTYLAYLIIDQGKTILGGNDIDSESNSDITNNITNLKDSEEADLLSHLKLNAEKTDEFSRILDLTKRKPYEQREDQFVKTLHWGQLKLFLTELEFLTKVKKEADGKEVWFVYAGSAPGDHIPYLHSLFPEMHFELYDPNEFVFDDTDMIKTHVQFFTDEDAKQWSNQENKYVAFCSDIRTEPATNENVERNMKMQREWWEIMQPDLAMFKFRLPWDDSKTTYMKGDIYIQAYPGHNSTETRLIVKKDAPIIEYDNRSYEEACFYHNTITRIKEHTMCGNFLLDKCYDCMTFEYLVREYIKYATDPIDLSEENIDRLIKEIEKKVTRHGKSTVATRTKDAFLDQLHNRKRKYKPSRATVENENLYKEKIKEKI